MSKNQLRLLAVKYCVEDLPESSMPGTSLANVISRLELAPDYIPEVTKDFLRKTELISLLKYACKEISFNKFTEVARSEQKERKLVADQIKKEQAKKAAINAETNRRRNILNKLLKKYGLTASFIPNNDIQKIETILEKADHGARIDDDEIAWLMIARKDLNSGYYTQQLRKKYHENEAEFFSNEYQRTNNPWDAINASSHFRKSHQSTTANSILMNINATQLKSRKMKSAFNTTLGGVKRDLKLLNEAFCLGNQAHIITPRDFRPCTLLGAVNMEMGNYDEGQSWYQKAIERGATEKSVDDDLRSIFMRADKSKRNDLGVFLYRRDPKRYSWVKQYMKYNSAQQNLEPDAQPHGLST